MKAFIYNGEVYLRAIPGKKLFQSTMVHEVANRGDIFAIRCSDQVLTIVPGKAEVEHIELTVPTLVRHVATGEVLSELDTIRKALTGKVGPL